MHRSQRSAWISFPTAPYTHDSALRAARNVLGAKGWRIVTTAKAGEEDVAPKDVDLYFADYDLLPFEDVHPSGWSSDGAGHASGSVSVLFPQLSSYVIRKSLIRKNYLAHSLHVARVKGGEKATHDVAPKTWAFEATCADDLDELLADDLYDVRLALERNATLADDEATWYIVKPAMADQGMGIRLFDSVEALEAIFEQFEEVSDDEEEGEGDGEDVRQRSGDRSTAVVTSQVRHFVIQQYLAHPLLVRAPTLQDLHKFHIRAYVLAQGGLRVFLYDEMLALFAPTPYARPAQPNDGSLDLACHLTNTSRQDDVQSQQTVHLLSDLVGCQIGGASDKETSKMTLSATHLDEIRMGGASVVAEAFKAATAADRVHFQPWPNAWEVFGVDLMVTLQDDGLRVWLLEINAQPDFAKTGAALQAKIDRLFERTLEVAVLGEGKEDWQPGISLDGMTLCLDMPMSAGGW